MILENGKGLKELRCLTLKKKALVADLLCGMFTKTGAPG